MLSDKTKNILKKGRDKGYDKLTPTEIEAVLGELDEKMVDPLTTPDYFTYAFIKNGLLMRRRKVAE